MRMKNMTTDETTRQATYDASSIQVLSGREAVRKRPGMYVGDTESSAGPHNMLYELLNNAVDEALAGHADLVEVVLYEDGSIAVSDNGRGIPTEPLPNDRERRVAEFMMTELHASWAADPSGYKTSGLWGVGAAAVNFLSERLELTIHRGGQTWSQRYQRGEPLGALSPVGESQRTGTTVRFVPDSELFATTEVDAHVIAERLQELSAITGRRADLTLSLIDRRGPEPWAQRYRAPLGLRSRLDELTGERQPLHPPLSIENTRHHKGERLVVELALQWSNTLDPGRLFTFANTNRTLAGGSHLDGLYEALITVLGERTGLELLREDVAEGLTGMLVVWLDRPRFVQATREQLLNDHVRAVVADVAARHLGRFLDDHPQEAAALGAKLARAWKRRRANR